MRPAELEISIPAGGIQLLGDLALPVKRNGLVIFAHGSGSSRASARNRYVAAQLQGAGFATLLLDLLTPGEERIDAQTAHFRFDITLLAERVEQAVLWARRQPDTRRLPIGLFGASTGAAAALIAAARLGADVSAVVSRGGRPDLAGEVLGEVEAPTLLVVGGGDGHVLRLNREALSRLKVKAELQIIPGATHLFEEAGALERVAELATNWFLTWIPGGRFAPGARPAAQLL